jgi:hypothetical protein
VNHGRGHGCGGFAMHLLQLRHVHRWRVCEVLPTTGSNNRLRRFKPLAMQRG